MTPRQQNVVLSLIAARVRELRASRRLAEMQLGRAHPIVGQITDDLAELRQVGEAVVLRSHEAA